MKLFGEISRESVYKNPSTWLESIHPEDKRRVKRALLKNFRGDYGYEEFYRIIRPDGTIRWIEVKAFPAFEEENKQPLYFVGIAIDITAFKESQELLREAKEEAEKANQAKSEFLANMSHEIRTPLNSVIGFSEVLLNEVEDEKQKDYLSTIASSGKSLLNIINNILDLSKIEAGKLLIQKTDCDLTNILKELHDIFKPKLEQKGIDFKVEIYDEFPLLVLDETKINQILLNLIGNAIKFTEKGFVLCKIEIIYQTQEIVNLRVEIIDTGIGISKSQQEIIFEEFTQQEGQNSEKYGGTGLGLTICKRLIQYMNGKIFLESEVNKGSNFILHFDNIQISKNQKKLNEIETIDTEQTKFLSSSILVVDDVQNNIDLIKHFLKNEDIQVYQANSGKVALSYLEKNTVDIIIMDLKMPVMNGIETAKKIKKIKSFKKIPIICYTASERGTKDSKELFIFDSFIFKPIQKKQLFSELKKYLRFEMIQTSERKTEQIKHVYSLWNTIQGMDNDTKQSIKNTIKNNLLSEIDDLILLQSPNRYTEYYNKLCDFSEKYNLIRLKTTLMDLKKYMDTFEYQCINKLLENIKITFFKIIEE